DSGRGPVSAQSFPTLAEQLDAQAEHVPSTSELAPLMFLIEGTIDDEPVRTLVDQAHTEAPPSSLVSVVFDGVAQTAPASSAGPMSSAERSVRPARDLDDLRVLLDALPGADLVLVAPPHQLTAELLGHLASAAELDTVCASISASRVDTRGQWSRGAAERGIP